MAWTPRALALAALVASPFLAAPSAAGGATFSADRCVPEAPPSLACVAHAGSLTPGSCDPTGFCRLLHVSVLAQGSMAAPGKVWARLDQVTEHISHVHGLLCEAPAGPGGGSCSAQLALVWGAVFPACMRLRVATSVGERAERYLARDVAAQVEAPLLQVSSDFRVCSDGDIAPWPA